MHVEDPGALTLFQYRARIVQCWQAYLVRVYTLYRLLPKFRGVVAPGLHPRVRPQGAAPLPRPIRTDLRWQAQHDLTQGVQGDACLRCGRVSRAQRQGRLQQWRRACIPLHVHAQRLRRGHTLCWTGVWGCSRCPCMGAHLHKRGCHPLRRFDPGEGHPPLPHLTPARGQTTSSRRGSNDDVSPHRPRVCPGASPT